MKPHTKIAGPRVRVQTVAKWDRMNDAFQNWSESKERQRTERIWQLAAIGRELADLVIAIPHGIDPRTREAARRFILTAEGKRR